MLLLTAATSEADVAAKVTLAFALFPDPEGSVQDGEAITKFWGCKSLTIGDAYPENGIVLESIGLGGSAKDSRLVSEEECFVTTEVVLAGSVTDTGLMLVFSGTCNNGGDKAEEGEGEATETETEAFRTLALPPNLSQ